MISIIIPSYNSAHLVSDAIASVLNQAYAEVEVIVIDDGSTDGTGSVVQAIAAQDPRVIYVHQANQGLGGARNTGIARARGEYLAVLDADDLLLPNKLALQADALARNPELGLVAGGHQFSDLKTGQLLAERRPWQHRPHLDLETWLMGCPFVVHSVLMRTEWARKVGGFAKLHRAEDRDFWLRLSHAGCRMAWTPEIVCDYRLHMGQMTRNGQAQHETTLQVLQQFYAQSNLPTQVLALRERSFGNAHLSGAFRMYGSDQTEPACDSLAQAISLLPHLMAGDPPTLAFTLMSWACEPHHNDPTAFAERVLNHLPAQAAPLAAHRTKILTTTAVWAALDAIAVGNAALAQQHWRNAAPRLPTQGQSTTAAITNALADYPANGSHEQHVACAESFFDALPELTALRNKTLAHLHMARAFKAQASGATQEAGRALRKGVQLDRSWLRNRGVLSIWVKTLLKPS